MRNSGEELKVCVSLDGLTWRAAVALYAARLLRRGLSRTSQVHARRTLRLLEGFLSGRGRSRPADVRVDDVAAFLVWARRRPVPTGRRRGQPVTDGTVRVWCQNMRGFFRWLVREGHLLMDPTVALDPIPVRRNFPRVLSLGETERLLAAAGDTDSLALRTRALLELGYSCALRAGELLGLDLLDLNLAAGEVSIRRGKGGKDRCVPVGGPAVRALGAYLENGRDAFVPSRRQPRPTAVFLSCRGTRLRSDLANRALARRACEAGITGRVTLHTLRHSAAVHMLVRGADVRVIAELLGHASVETTVWYTRLVLGDLKETLARAHPRSRWVL